MKFTNKPNRGGVFVRAIGLAVAVGGHASVAEREVLSVHPEAEGLSAAASAVSMQPVMGASAGTAGAVPCRILLVEDHADTGIMMRRLLVRRGYQVTVATSCADALAAAGAHPFDLVLSDLGLPDGSGLDLVGPLSRLTNAPAIAVSGYGMPDDARKSAEAGFAVHLTKPVAVERLWAAVDGVLGSRAGRIAG